MIREWSVERFKSIAERQRISLRGLTVLAGANSSGKSTVLQSMLVLAQTITSKVEQRHLLLNGDLVRLGNLDDVISQSDGPGEITLAFKIESEPDFLRSRVARNLYWWPWGRPQSRAVVDATLRFGKVEGDHGPRRAELIEGSFECAPTSTRVATSDFPPNMSGKFSIRRRSNADAEAAQVGCATGHVNESLLKSALRYDLQTAQPLGGQDFPFIAHGLQTGSFDVAGTTLDHFLPQGLAIKASTIAREVEAALDELQHGQTQDVTETLQQWRTTGNEVRRALADIYPSTAPDSAKAKRRTSSGRVDAHNLLAKVREHLRDSENVHAKYFDVVPPTALMALVNACVSTELGSLRYLGPLRDEPRPLHAIGSGSDPRDIGTRGEFTAAVLDVYGSLTVQYVAPNDVSGAVQHRSLSAAVLEWLRHFGVAEEVHAEEAGSLGHRLYVRPDGVKRQVDLTGVGVGVSQVLPILVMALISEPRAVLLFEQPELHLHPRVQSQLADFFISVMQTGRQCILETHSEYLVNRLRRRVAESPWTSPLGNDVLLYFVERTQGQSTFAPIDINPYGAIPDWPRGFFDQGPAESESILAAASRKRATKPEPAP